jgi:hypothetical protein
VKRLSAILLAILLALAALTLARLDPAMADGFNRQYRHHGDRGAYAAPDPAYENVCSAGWWQTLRYGHVRPQWGIRCLRPGPRRHVD